MHGRGSALPQIHAARASGSSQTPPADAATCPHDRHVLLPASPIPTLPGPRSPAPAAAPANPADPALGQDNPGSVLLLFSLMLRRPRRSTPLYSSAASR